MTPYLPGLRRTLLAFVVLFLSQWWGGPTRSQALYTIGGFELVSEQRITRTVSQYTYRAALTNGGGALGGAIATATSVSSRTTIVDGSVSFAAMAAGATLSSGDTFSFRHDRTTPFSWTNLRWQVTPMTYAPPVGVLLIGSDTTPAINALVRRDPVGADPADVVDHVILTRLEAVFGSDTTVAQINAALASVGGGIVTMRPGLPVVTIAVPRQPDEASLQMLADRVAAMLGIRMARIGRTTMETIAPDAPANEARYFKHLQATRFPAAWNVNALAECETKVDVLVADHFRRPPSLFYGRFDTEVPGVVEFGGGTRDLNLVDDHGRDVMGTLAGAFNNAAPTGANPFPECLSLRALQVSTLSLLEAALEVERLVAAKSGPTVVNLSFGYYDECRPEAECLMGPDWSWVEQEPTTEWEFRRARAVARAVDAIVVRHLMRPHQDRVILVPAAGNDRTDVMGSLYGGVRDGRFSTPWSIAATSDAAMSWVHDPALWDPTPVCTPTLLCFPSLAATPAEQAVIEGLLSDLDEWDGAPLANVLIAGSTNGVERSSFSEEGATVLAVGEEIPTMFGDLVDGTSFAAPQVAGLASYLLMVKPGGASDEAAVSQVVSAITSNVVAVPAGQIDAYASVLSLDPVGSPDAATWDIRRTLLDVTGDRQFTEADLVEMVQRFFEAPDYEFPVQPLGREDSRYDLNGDGFTGGILFELPPFDLDRTGSIPFGAPLLTELEFYIGGTPMPLDERSVTDVEIMCFYAYSPLYQGSESERETVLANRCTPITVTLDPTGGTLRPGQTLQFAADVEGTTDAHVTWSLPGGGGTISDAGVFTAGTTAGSFPVRATSVVDTNRFGEATVTIDSEGGDIPPNSYAGTVVQQVETSSRSTATNPEGQTFVTTDDASEVVTWRILAEDGDFSDNPGTITYLYRSTHVGWTGDGQPCNYTITTSGDVPISGMRSNASGGLYFYGSGQVTQTRVTACGEGSGTTTSVLSYSFTTASYHMPGSTTPTETYDTSRLIGMTWNSHWTDPNHPHYISSVTGQVTYYP